jgi:hypothetical protein
MSPTVFRLANIMAHIDASDREIRQINATLPSGRLPLLSAMGRATPASAFLFDELLVRDAFLAIASAPDRYAPQPRGWQTEGKKQLERSVEISAVYSLRLRKGRPSKRPKGPQGVGGPSMLSGSSAVLTIKQWHPFGFPQCLMSVPRRRHSGHGRNIAILLTFGNIAGQRA